MKLMVAILALKGIATEACICDMDHGSQCQCSAAYDAREALTAMGEVVPGE